MPGVLFEHNVPARMRDGVILYANVYRPVDPGLYPVLLARLPYGKDISPWQNVLNPMRAAMAGYVVIVQDCRGRFASEGEFRALVQEGPDGHDTVEWASQLPYSSGAVGMFGASYYGYTQWSAAAEQPPHLRAIAPMITWSRYGDGPSFRHGAFELGLGLYWTLLMAVDVAKRKLAAAGVGPAESMPVLKRIIAAVDRLSVGGFMELPLRDLGSLKDLSLAGILGSALAAGPVGMPQTYNVQHDAIEVPSLNLGGWYDICVQGTVENYQAMKSRGRPTALVMGPWSHLNHTGAVSEMDFGMAASATGIELVSDLTDIQLRWFDHWLKGKDNGVDRDPPVYAFMMGENRWHRLPDWPPVGAESTPWYLHPDGGLALALPGGGSSAYVYDPVDPAPTLGGNILMPGKFGAGAKDHRPLSRRADVLTFTGETLQRTLTITGRVTADLWVSSSAPDTDFVVRLIDIHPDGFMQNICDGLVRARYRNSLSHPEWLTPGEACEVKVDLWSTAHQFQPGHRVAVQVTSSSFPRWDRNLNTTAGVGAGTEWQVARQKIWHDASRPSCLWMPALDS